ncbi:MAG: MFS transporter [Acidilobus sp.]
MKVETASRAALGYPVLYVTLGVFLIVLGNVTLNLFLASYEARLGRRGFLVLYSLLMAASGVTLELSRSMYVIAPALLLSGMSTTGTETGPFQSVEVSVIPKLYRRPGRALGAYNLLGYAASSMGALSLSLLSRALAGDLIEVAKVTFLLYVAAAASLALTYRALRGVEAPAGQATRAGLSGLLSNRDVAVLSALFSVDAFGGGLVSQSLLSLWFHLRYRASAAELGIVFGAANAVTAASLMAAPLIAERVGNLRTMVFTHLASNVLLALIPFGDSLGLSAALLLARQSLSQMDVPTRQAFMADIFDEGERVRAFAVTNTFRSLAGLPGPLLVGAMLSSGLLAAPFVLSGAVKAGYDGSIYLLYRGRARVSQHK